MWFIPKIIQVKLYGAVITVIGKFSVIFIHCRNLQYCTFPSPRDARWGNVLIAWATLFVTNATRKTVETIVMKLQNTLETALLSLSYLGWHTLPSHASAEACLTGWHNAQPQVRDWCSVARHHQANLMVCVVCSCCATSPYREVYRAKGGIGSEETMCHAIYPARPITTVSLAANTYCKMDGHTSCAPRTVDPRVQFSGACKQSHWWPASGYSRRPSVISGLSSD